MRVRMPAGRGPWELEIEILIETDNTVVSSIFQNLSAGPQDS